MFEKGGKGKPLTGDTIDQSVCKAMAVEKNKNRAIQGRKKKKGTLQYASVTKAVTLCLNEKEKKNLVNIFRSIKTGRC